jgi:hypothetical protein
MPEAYACSYEVVVQIYLDGNQRGAVVGPDPTGGGGRVRVYRE